DNNTRERAHDDTAPRLIGSAMPPGRRSPSAPKGLRRRAHRANAEAPIKIVQDALQSFLVARADLDALDQLEPFGSAGRSANGRFSRGSSTRPTSSERAG